MAVVGWIESVKGLLCRFHQLKNQAKAYSEKYQQDSIRDDECSIHPQAVVEDQRA
jgi:hypothetical protein